MIPEGLHPGEPLASTQALGCPAPHQPLPRTSGHWPRLTFLLLLSPSKQRHNKLWRQQADDSCLQQPVDDRWAWGLPARDPGQHPKPSCPAWTLPPPCPVPRQRGLGAPLCPAVSATLRPLLRAPGERDGRPRPPEYLERDALLEEGVLSWQRCPSQPDPPRRSRDSVRGK